MRGERCAGGEEPASGAGLAAGEAGSSCGPASAGSAEGRCTGLGQTWELRVARALAGRLTGRDWAERGSGWAEREAERA